MIRRSRGNIFAGLCHDRRQSKDLNKSHLCETGCQFRWEFHAFVIIESTLVMPPTLLRIRAIGGRNVTAKSGLAGMFEAKLNPFVVLVVGNEEKHLAVVKNVGAKEFSWGDDAMVDFVWPEASSPEIKLHVKDKDTNKDRYVGGAKLSFPVDLTSNAPQTKHIDLEFSDEKLKTKKGRGQVTLSFERVVSDPGALASTDGLPMKPSVPSVQTTGKRMLRIQAMGGANLAPKTGLEKMIDADPDPYLVITVAGVTKSFPELNNVKTKEFVWGHDAVQEYEVANDAIDVVLHCKDKDTLKDHYIGGTQWSWNMADMLATPTWKQTVDLDFATSDFKSKAKESRGKIYLSCTLIDPNPPAKPTEPLKESTIAHSNQSNAEGKTVTDTPSGQAAPRSVGINQTPAQATSSTELYSPVAGTDRPESKATTSSTDKVPDQQVNAVSKCILRVQAVGGANLTPKTGLQHLMDADADPYLVITVAGVTKSFPQLNNVKTKEFVWGQDAVEEFEVGNDVVNVVLHCKDKDMLKDHYIGGTQWVLNMADMLATPTWSKTVDLDFATPDFKTKAKESRGKIHLSFTLIEPGTPPVKKTIEPSNASTSENSKQSPAPASESESKTSTESSTAQRTQDRPPSDPPSATSTTKMTKTVATVQSTTDDKPTNQSTSEPPAQMTLPLNIDATTTKFKRTLKVQAVGGSNLAPKTGIERMMDSEPDPYLIVVLGKTTKLYPVVDNVKTNEFVWGADAVHDFDVPCNDQEIALSIHCKDKDLLLDHYIGGAHVTIPIALFGSSKSLLRHRISLDFSDASFKTKAPKSRGDLVLSFFLVDEPLPEPTKVPPLRTPLSPRKATLSARLYKGNLRLIAHGAKGLTLPPRQVGVVDKRADPYVVFQLGTERIACPEAKDGHTAPSWADATHTFAIDTGQHSYVDILVLDKKQDRFMAATRLRLVEYLSPLTNQIQATVVVKLDCDQSMHSSVGGNGELQLSLLFTPWDPNLVTWKGATVGHIQLSHLSVSNYADVLSRDQEIQLEISIRRHVSAVQGYITCQTTTIQPISSKPNTPMAWPDQVLSIPYAIFLHENMTKDKCPVVVFALHDKHAITQDKPLVQNALSLLDLLGLNGSKQLPLLHPKLPGRVSLAFTVATTTSLTSNPVKAVVTAKSCLWGRGDCVLDEVDATPERLVVWNSTYEAQYLPAQVKSADTYTLQMDILVGAKGLGPLDLPVLALLHKHGTREFTMDAVQVVLALGFDAMVPKPDIVSPRTSCVDFGPGILHLVIYKAEGLVPDGNIAVDDIDPEVRVALKPRPTIKQKDGRSSAKTRPLENAGRDPIWNEYLKIDYSPNKDPAAPQVSPMVVFSINDIQMVGETAEMNVVGVAEVPLAAFVVANSECNLFSSKLLLERNGQRTGTLVIAGIYESKTAPEAVRNGCHNQGQKLRLATPSSLTNFVESSYCAGRLDIHVAMAKDLNQNPQLPYRCELCLSSHVDDRVSLLSRHTDTTDIVWDNQLTLYTQTAKADFLRVDLFQRYTGLFELTFVHRTASTSGVLYVTLDSFDSRHVAQLMNKKLSLRVTLLNATATESDPDASKQVAIFPFHVITESKVLWHYTVALVCPPDLTKQTAAQGTCVEGFIVVLCICVAFGKDAIARDDLSIQALLLTPNAVLTKRLPNSTIAAEREPLGFTKLRLVYVPGSSTPPPMDMNKTDESRRAFHAQFTDVLPPNRGVLSLRIISGRNLADVDALGDQDPYVQLGIDPPSYQLPPGSIIHAQSGVCVNGGRHPQWNSPVYTLTIHDSNVEAVTIRVLDSGEEDNVPDAVIGSCQLSVYSLIHMAEHDDRNPLTQRWNEGWFTLYQDQEPAGDLRLEYRFVPENATRVRLEPPTKYINCLGGRGKMAVKVISGANLPCVSGMVRLRTIPAVRIFVESTQFAHVTQPEKRSLVNPQWNETILFDVEWTPELTTPHTVRVEVVDLGGGTSNHLPILAQCTINVAAFAIHPLETHYGRYELTTFQLQKRSREPSSLHLAVQFLPLDATAVPLDDPFVPPEAGQIHVNVVSAAFRTNDAFRPFVRCSLHHDVAACQTKATPSCVSDLDEYTFCEWTSPLLFDFTPSDKANVLPSLDVQMLCQPEAVAGGHDEKSSTCLVLGELANIPLFPFVLHKGHVNVVWYPVYCKSTLVAQLKLEIQFLKTSPVPKATFTDVLTVQVLEGRALWSAQDASKDADGDNDAQDPFVELEFLGHRVKVSLSTKAHVDGGTDPSWQETFELPLLGLDPSILPVLTLKVCNQDIKRLGDGVIGTSRYVVPTEVVRDGKLRDVWLTLSSSGSNMGSKDSDLDLGKIHVRLKRGHFDTSGLFVDTVNVSSAGEDTKEAPNLAGVLYIFGPTPLDVRAALRRPTSSSGEAATSFRLADMGVLPVPWQDEPLKRHFPHTDLTLTVDVPKTGQQLTMTADEVQAVFRTPRREFLRSSDDDSTGKTNAASVKAVEFSVLYMAPTQGLVQVSIAQIDGVAVRHGNAYYVEFRVLRNSPWVKSPTTKATSEDKSEDPSLVVWKSHVCRELQYSNFREHMPPTLQLVVYTQDNPSSTWTKLAFGQLNLLQYIASPSQYPTETIPLTCVGKNGSNAKAIAAIGFIPVVVTSQDDAEAKALQLAAGTAAMKKSFQSLGGDEATPLDIATLQAAASNDEKCMHMLAKAADLVGGMDALFAAMDTNKDGKISWEEYLDRMQIVHALADEASTKPATLQPSNPGNDDESQDESDEQLDEEPEAKQTATTLSYQPWRPPMPQQPGRIHDSDDDDDEEIEDILSLNAAAKTPSPNSAISPMVALPPNEIVTKLSAPRTIAPPKPRAKGPDETAWTTWKVADVSTWLEVELELPQYVGAFADASVDGRLLLSLTPDDIDQHFNIQQPLHRRKLIARIQQLQQKFGGLAVTTASATICNDELPNPTHRLPQGDPNPVQLGAESDRQTIKRPTKAAPRVVVDLNAKGQHEVERSRLAFKAQRKKKQQRHDQVQTDHATKRWTFEYTGEAKPTRVQTAIEKVASVLAKDEQAISGYEGAMQDALKQVVPSRLHIPLVANTDEIVEVVKQAIWRHAETLSVAAMHQAAIDKDASSDFGDDDEATEDMKHPTSSLELVFLELCALKNNGARWLHENATLSRLKFEGGLLAMLGIHMSWHQFDLLFRRLDTANQGEISWTAFSAAFGDPIPGNAMSNDMLAVKEGLVLMLERLEEHELTLHQAWQAFDRDNSGAISVAEFSTLIKFLTHKEGVGSLSKHQIYLMMATLDVSYDRCIQYPEFMKFIYIVWSHRLLQLQQYLSHKDENPTESHHRDVVNRKVQLRKALRTNFSRPFRDAMRCSPVAIPGPFQGLLAKFHLQPPNADGHIQIWQVLKGEVSSRSNAPAQVAPKPAKHKRAFNLIDQVAEEIRAHETDSELLTTAYQKLKHSTDTTLSLMLQRCEEQRKIQHAMAVLHRFRPMLEVPARLRSHLQNRDYLHVPLIHAYRHLNHELVQLVEEYLQLKANVTKANVAMLLKPVLLLFQVFDAAHATAVQANAALLQVIESPTASLSTHVNQYIQRLYPCHLISPQREAIQALDWLNMVPKPALVCVKHQLAAVDKQLLLCMAAGPATDTTSSKQPPKLPAKLKASTSAVTQQPPRSPVEIVAICRGVVATMSHSVWGLVCDTMKAATLSAGEQEALHASVVVILTTTVKHLEDHLVGQCTTPEVTMSMQSLFVQFDSLKPCPDSVLNAKLAALKQRCCVQLRQDTLLACFAAHTQRTGNEWLAYVTQNDWTAAIDVLAKRSIGRPDSSGVLVKWWKGLHPLLVASIDTNTSPSDEGHRTVFCPALYDGVAAALTALVTGFTDSIHGMLESTTCAPLVGLANAVEVHGLLSPLLAHWLALQPQHIADIVQPVDSTKDACFQAFLAPRLDALDAALQGEEMLAANTSSIGNDDDTNNPSEPHGDESRQYLFSVLLLLVTWRHEIDRCIPVGAYGDSMLRQCLAKIASHLDGRIRTEVAADGGGDGGSTWRLTHLHVELAFVCTHFKQWMPQQAASLESTVLKAALKTKRDVVQALASQLDMQTHMYRLCLSS
ncbi:hypothetical protein DYB37_002466 [Aphanomyces astaci]|uniref:Uncharacterized protein n=1 Tax=Aphanomyces astaci TaxID=112090 RepID=A0A418FEH8_APHAT|nr:hypothetical protein DYB37_002466 [Aphanomyces astaci]